MWKTIREYQISSTVCASYHIAKDGTRINMYYNHEPLPNLEGEKGLKDHAAKVANAIIGIFANHGIDCYFWRSIVEDRRIVLVAKGQIVEEVLEKAIVESVEKICCKITHHE